MLQVSGISKRYGDHVVLQDVSFTIHEGDRLGLIGPNGCGKTTLLRIIAGRERADEGSVHATRAHLRLGTLEQGLVTREDETLATLLGVGEEQLARAEAEVVRLAEAVAEAGPDEQPARLAAYGRALEALEAAAAKVSATHAAEAVLAGLGLGHLPLETPVAILSGGQKTRLGLAKVLLEDPQLLLLDEPTNHLDIEALQWLEAWLAGYPGGALIVSHDRTLLDRTVHAILDLDPETHTVTVYPGNYGDYIEAKARERETQWAAYREQQERIARIRGEVSRLGNYAGSIERGTIDFAIRKIAKGIARRAVVQKRRLERELAEERLEKPGQSWQLKLDFGELPATGQDVLILEELAAGYEGVPLFAGINGVLRAGERVALVGPNGSGKTTLLRVMSGELAPLAGRVRLGANVRLGMYAQEQEDLDPESTPLETIRGMAAMSETELRSFLHFFLFSGDDVLVANRDLSYGERARLALAQLVASGCNCLLLDEPINHLDIPSRAKFEQAMTAFEGTVLAVVHDRYFIRRFATQVWSLDGGALRRRYDLEGSEL